MKQNIGLLFLRVSIGLIMMLSHGWPKLMNFGVIATKFPDPIGIGGSASLALAVFAEFFCSAALILGLLTRWVSIPLLITMLVALFLVHGSDPWKKQEFVVLYIIPYISLICLGGGDYSVDRIFLKKQG